MRTLPALLALAVPLALLSACGHKDGTGGGDGATTAAAGDDGGTEDGGDDGSDDGGTTEAPDADGDGYTDAAAGGTDCDDSDSTVHPDADELCDGIDNNCDGELDPDTSLDARRWHADTDGDTFGDADDVVVACHPSDGRGPNDRDCDDTNAEVNPDATEVCDDDDVDEDCNGVADDTDAGVDPASMTTYYPDADADGFGDAFDAGTPHCEAPSDGVTDNTDCDDTLDSIYPGANEVCDEVDNNCDGAVDDADATIDTTTQTLFYPDVDVDVDGDLDDAGTLSCAAPSGLVADNTDCDDSSASVNPAATEVCNGIDDDCDSTTSEAGMVSWTDSTGTLTDITSTFNGTISSPAAHATTADGTLSFCDGTFYTNLEVNHNVTLEGVSSAAVLDGASTDPVITTTTCCPTPTWPLRSPKTPFPTTSRRSGASPSPTSPCSAPSSSQWWEESWPRRHRPLPLDHGPGCGRPPRG